MTTLLLAGLALILAGPVPALLSGWMRLRHTPTAAMVLWQALALAAMLSALGAGLSLATWTGIGTGNSWLEYAVAAAAVALTAMVLWRLAISGHRVGTELRAIRRRHRELLDLLAPETELGSLRVVDHDAPTAYCIPGRGSSRVVISQGALARLSPDAVQAVLEHERAHLRSRHDLVVEAFTVLHRAFPAVISSQQALAEVVLLVEVLADRAAVRRVGAKSLIAALDQLGGSSAPGVATGDIEGIGAGVDQNAAGGVLARLAVLTDRRRHPLQSALLLASAGAVLVLPTLLVALPWLRSLARIRTGA